MSDRAAIPSASAKESATLRYLHAQLKPMLPVLGITRLAHIGGLDILGLPVAQAVRPLSCSLSVAQGKGVSRLGAEISAVLEAAETWHAERISLPMAVGSFSDLSQRMHCAALETLPVYTGLDANGETPYRWVASYDIATKDSVLIPYDLVHTRFTPKHNDLSSPFYRSTSGLAAGVVRERVLAHAICEVVERDATAQFGFNKRGGVSVSLDTAMSEGCVELLARIKSAGIECELWFLPHPSKIPVFHAVLEGGGGRLQGNHFKFGGYGCNLCPQRALEQALFEAAQSRLTVIAGSRDDLNVTYYNTRREPATTVLARPKGNELTLDAIVMSPEDQIAELLYRLNAAGFSQILVVDLGQPSIGLEVLRVVIPGMDTSVSPGDCQAMPRFEY